MYICTAVGFGLRREVHAVQLALAVGPSGMVVQVLQRKSAIGWCCFPRKAQMHKAQGDWVAVVLEGTSPGEHKDRCSGRQLVVFF